MQGRQGSTFQARRKEQVYLKQKCVQQAISVQAEDLAAYSNGCHNAQQSLET